jgi:transitional endoplasmic reticulum ATPase
MAKKKTKSKAALLVAEAVASVNATKELVEHKNELQRNEISQACNDNASSRQCTVEFFPARLKSTVGRSYSLHMQPRVIMTSSDALRLNVQVGEDVILMSLNDISHRDKTSDHTTFDEKIKAVAVLPLEIYNEKHTTTGNSNVSPALRRKSVSQQWIPGTIQVTSSSLLAHFDSESFDDPINVSNEDDGAQTYAATPVSLASTHFSFKDIVQSPSSSNTKRRVLSSSKNDRNNRHNKVQCTIYVITSRSKLGQFILQSLCLGCTKLIVEPIDVVSEPTELNDAFRVDQTMRSSSSVRILERLIQANIVGSYVHKGQILRISFAGKPFHVRIVNIVDEHTASKSKTTSHILENKDYLVDCEFSRLNIQDVVSDTSETIALDSSFDLDGAKLLSSTILDCRIRLYKIRRSTIISIYREPQDKVTTYDHVDQASIQNMAQPVPSIQYVAGLSSTLHEVRSHLLTPLTQPEFFTKRGMKPPQGVLLHGPSGVGKTCLAKQLLSEIEANASEWNCRVRYVHCASLQSKSTIVGEAESVLSKFFQPSYQKSTLIVLDDVHLICARRGRGSTGGDRLAATLLALMDGIKSNEAVGRITDNNAISSQAAKSIVILAITTNPSLLDPALRRPGRLDNEVEVPLPEEVSTRADILQFHANKFGVRVADSLTNQNVWLEAAKLAKGFNGADCMLAVKEAVRLAILELRGSEIIVRQDHLNSAIRSIKPSAIKSITIEIPRVLWSSIGGMVSVKRELREAIELPLSHSEYFKHMKISPPRGILLYGPPGCSKTLMARALATEGNMNFLAVKGPELLSKWLGESERALSSLFRRARMASPAIIFFDEIDAIASKRGSSDSASSNRLLSQLLTELDGINHSGSAAINKPSVSMKQHRVVVVGATNRPDLLDTALTRPGRIDRMIYVGLPDAASRAQIIQLSIQNVACGNDIDIPTLASDACSAGFSGAEMVAICRDASLLALEEVSDCQNVTASAESEKIDNETRPMVEMRHLLSAMQDMQRQITPAMINFYTSYTENHYRSR